MDTESMWRAPDIVPTLAYDDVPAAADWLSRVFGFKERTEARLYSHGGCRTWMEIGDGLVNLSSSGGHDLHSPRTVGGLSLALKVYVDDVDGHCAHAKAAGANIIDELQDGFWGGRSYRVADLEGHQWLFSQKGRDLAAKDWRLPPGISRGQ